MLYSNGVMVTSEDKSSKARRGYPVDRVVVDFSRTPFLQPEVVQLVQRADIILFAPGSLYTSIIPILQVPGLAEAIRRNTSALKVLVVEGDTLAERTLQTGVANWEFTEVLSGLDVGERIVTSLEREGVVAGAKVLARPAQAR